MLQLKLKTVVKIIKFVRLFEIEHEIISMNRTKSCGLNFYENLIGKLKFKKISYNEMYKVIINF